MIFLHALINAFFELIDTHLFVYFFAAIFIAFCYALFNAVVRGLLINGS